MLASVNVSKYVPAKRPVGRMNHVSFVNAAAPEVDIVTGPNADVPIRSTFLNVAVEIADRPLTDIVTLAPDAAVVGAVNVGAPITVKAASAVSVGVAIETRNV